MPFEEIITYPDDRKTLIHDEFVKIIHQSGWEEDIRLATESLEYSATDAEKMREEIHRVQCQTQQKITLTS